MQFIALNCTSSPKYLILIFLFWNYFQIIHLSCYLVFIKGWYSSINDSLYFVFVPYWSCSSKYKFHYLAQCIFGSHPFHKVFRFTKIEGLLGKGWLCAVSGDEGDWFLALFHHRVGTLRPIPVFLSMIGFRKQRNSRWNVSSCTA